MPNQLKAGDRINLKRNFQVMPGAQWLALLWAAAFGLYAVRYRHVLTRPRLDGKPG